MSERDQCAEGALDEWIVDGSGECLLRGVAGWRPAPDVAVPEPRGLWDWSPDMELGIPVLDKQHKRLAGILEKLLQADKRRDREAVGDLLARIDAALCDHFATEERLMEIAYYPGLKEHQEAHRAFYARLSHYREQFLEGQEIVRPLLSDLKVYLTNHMQEEDRRYAPYILRVAKRGWVERMLHALFPRGGMD